MNKSEIGMSLAGCLLSISTIIVLAKGKVFTAKEIDTIITLSRGYLTGPGFLVGSPDTLHAAEEALQVAERLFRLVLSDPKYTA
jgi:hypothetical protein